MVSMHHAGGSSMRVAAVVPAFVLVLGVVPLARAADTLDAGTANVPQPSLYGDEASLAKPGASIGVSRTTFTSTSNGAMRPFASDVARAGNVLEAGAEVGLAPSLSFVATGLANGFYGYDATASGATAALRFAPFGDGPARFVASFGALRDLGGRAGVFSRASFAADVGRFRVASTMHCEHAFDPTRDLLDVMVTAGASYAVTDALRLGAEYVAQDLEGALDPTEKEGVRHFVGPTVGWSMGDRLWATAGPAVGLSYASPQLVGRLAVAYAF